MTGDETNFIDVMPNSAMASGISGVEPSGPAALVLIRGSL
jgi:hypothetical protein